MFSYIKGIVGEVSADYVVVENNGIGFQIMTSQGVTSAVRKGESITMYTHLNVREDDMSLFGFPRRDELNCFKLLINISGIGPKGALAILSALSLDELKLAVLSEDYKAIAKANGVGAKTAQRVVIELKDKFKLEDISYVNGNEDLPAGAVDDTMSETAQALVALGYSNSEALRAIKRVKDYEKLSVEELLKEALKKML
jgi:Holliday junction DNA helicase RuvA